MDNRQQDYESKNMNKLIEDIKLQK